MNRFCQIASRSDVKYSEENGYAAIGFAEPMNKKFITNTSLTKSET
jgi:hypothetical protein